MILSIFQRISLCYCVSQGIGLLPRTDKKNCISWKQTKNTFLFWFYVHYRFLFQPSWSWLNVPIYTQKTQNFEIWSCDSEDIVVYVQAAYTSQQIRRLVHIPFSHDITFVRDLCTEEIGDTLIPFHVMISCDQNSSFHDHGKKFISDKFARNTSAIEEIWLTLWIFIISYVYAKIRVDTR